MKAALPYLGIVLILVALSVLISFFMNGGFGPKEEIQANGNPVMGADFPEVGDAAEARKEQVSEVYPSPKEEEQIEIKSSSEELVAGVLGEVGKQADIGSANFKWQRADGRGTVALGHQTKFQGNGADVSKAKEYLRKQKFFLDANNSLTTEGVSAEGFLRDKVACIISWDSGSSSNFLPEDGEGETEIRVSCGVPKQR